MDELDAARRALRRGAAPGRTRARFEAELSRRGFLKGAGRGGALGALGLAGAPVDRLLRGLFGRGLLPAAWAEEAAAEVPGKPGMRVHATRPLTGEFPPHLLADALTPTARHFVRCNGVPPGPPEDPEGWTLRIDGRVETPLRLTLAELKAMPAATLPLVVECGGNGRAFFEPPVRGTQWRHGAVACAAWTGVRLRDLLARAGVAPDAVYTAHYGADTPLGAAQPFSRGVPLAKALDEHTLVAWAMNGEPLAPLHGAPLRLVVPGWVGSCSQKWLTRISLLDHEHDSQKMRGYSYRIPRAPVAPGKRPTRDQMEVATAWPVKSMVTAPAAGAAVPAGAPLEVRGHAWSGGSRVTRVRVSVDYGVTWTDAELAKPPNPFAWAGWRAGVRLPGPGYFEVWARAFDDAGQAQPFRQPWNPKGYLGNVVHRVPVTAT